MTKGNLITGTQWNKLEHNRCNSCFKIGYVGSNGQFSEVACWRNSCTDNGSNYGCLQVWCNILYGGYFARFSSQRSNNVCGNYNKVDANLTNCICELKEELKKHSVESKNNNYDYYDCYRAKDFLLETLQHFYTEKLFVVTFC